MIRDTKFKLAFTLSEVLIVIAVVGIVSGITLPILVKNYQKQVWVNQLKKSYSVLQHGFKMIIADEGVDLLSQTTVFQSIDVVCYASSAPNNKRCKNFYDKLYKYFKIINIEKFDAETNYKIKYLNSDDYSLKNGSVIQISELYLWGNFQENASDGAIAELKIDVNGKKSPNTYGRDIFVFILADNGYIYPWGSVEESKLSFGHDRHYWRTSGNIGHCCNPQKCLGSGCTARVLEEGKMNY